MRLRDLRCASAASPPPPSSSSRSRKTHSFSAALRFEWQKLFLSRQSHSQETFLRVAAQRSREHRHVIKCASHGMSVRASSCVIASSPTFVPHYSSRISPGTLVARRQSLRRMSPTPTAANCCLENYGRPQELIKQDRLIFAACVE